KSSFSVPADPSICPERSDDGAPRQVDCQTAPNAPRSVTIAVSKTGPATHQALVHASAPELDAEFAATAPWAGSAWDFAADGAFNLLVFPSGSGSAQVSNGGAEVINLHDGDLSCRASDR